MRKHKKLRNIWEYLKIGENTSGNFSEFLAIPIIESLEETVFEIYGNYWKLQKHTGHVTDLVLPGEGIFESFFAQDWDIWLPTRMKRTDTEHMFPASTLHACTIQFATIWKSWRPTRTSKSWVDFAVLSSNFVCFRHVFDELNLLRYSAIKVNWGKEKPSQFCMYNWSVYGSFATITQNLTKLTSFVPFTKNSICKLTKYGLSPKRFCIPCSVTQIMVKTYNCSCDKNVYLCWCSNVYR